MQNLIIDWSYKPPIVTAFESAADFSYGSEFSRCQNFTQSTQRHPPYEPGRYATLPTRLTGADRRPSGREAGKGHSYRRSVEERDGHVSHSLETRRKGASLSTVHDGKPLLLEEHQGESTWNPRASMAFDNAKGLLNPIGQNNCFLNSAVQVLWHLDVFRRNFRILSGHGCVQNACIFCALKVIFTQFQFSDHQVLPSDVLREALAEAFANERRFQLGRMDDASECFETILQRIHFHLAWNQSEQTCQVPHCITHQKFAMLLVEQTVCDCNASYEPLIFNQLVYHVSTSAIVSYLQLTCHGAPDEQEDLSFGRLLYQAKNSGNTRRCPARCGGLVETRHTLANSPEVVSIGFVWDSDRPSRSHVRQVIQCISTELRPSELVYSVVDDGWGRATTLRLAGLVCYHGRHYSTFFFHSKMLTWILFDDARVREIGPSWDALMDLCVAGLYQPLLLLYADPNGHPINISEAPVRNIHLQHDLGSILEENERDGIPEVTLNEKQSNASQVSSRRDLLFGGNCAAEKPGGSGRVRLSPDCRLESLGGKIKESSSGWAHSPGTMSLTRDRSTTHRANCAKRNKENFLKPDHLSFDNDKARNIAQKNISSQQATITEKAAANSCTNSDGQKSSFSLSPEQVGVGPCTSVAAGTCGRTTSNDLEPVTNRAKAVQFSHKGVGVSPGGTVENFLVSDNERHPRFHEQFSGNSDFVRSADHAPNSLHGIGQRPSTDGASDRSSDAQKHFQTVWTVLGSDHGPSQGDAHLTDEGNACGVYINEKTVRNTLSSQGVSLRRLAPREQRLGRSEQTSDSTPFVRSLGSSHSDRSKTENHSNNSEAYTRTGNEPNSTEGKDGRRCVEQGLEDMSLDAKQLSFHAPLNVHATDRGSKDLDFNDCSSASHGSKMQLYRDSLQMLNGCDKHVTLSKAELDVGNERLAAEHCRLATALLEDAFQPCQLDNDLAYLFRCSQNNVQKCQSNLNRYLTHFPNNDAANEEYPGLVESKRDLEPVFYLSAYTAARQVEPVNTKGRPVDDCKNTSTDICCQALPDDHIEGNSKCLMRSMVVKLTRDPAVNREIVDACLNKSNAKNNLSGVNHTNTVVRGGSSRNGKFANSRRDNVSSLSVPRSRTNLSSSGVVSAPLNSTSVPSSVSLRRKDTSVTPCSMSLPRARTSASSSVSVPRNCARVSLFSTSLPRNNPKASSSVSIPRNSTSMSSSNSLARNNPKASSSASIPRNNTSISSSKSIPRNSTSISCNSLPRNDTSVSSTSLNGACSASLSTKGTSTPARSQNTTSVYAHNQLPETRTSYQIRCTSNSEKTCKTNTKALTDCEPKGYSNCNDHGRCCKTTHSLGCTCGRTPTARCTTVPSNSVSVPSLVGLNLGSGDRTNPGARGTGLSGLSWPDSTIGGPSSLLLMSEKLQRLEEQNREIRDKLLKEKDVLWS